MRVCECETSALALVDANLASESGPKPGASPRGVPVSRGGLVSHDFRTGQGDFNPNRIESGPCSSFVKLLCTNRDPNRIKLNVSPARPSGAFLRPGL